jgi:hypothetical protein
MKNHRAFTFCIFLLLALFTSSCGGFPSGDDVKSFHKDLRGTWDSNEPGLYDGTLIIGTDTITINGYGEDWTSVEGDDSKRPFKDFPKRVPLKGYSEEGKIFINYGSTDPEGLPYIYTEVGKSPEKYKLLEFSFGGRKEILQSTVSN